MLIASHPEPVPSIDYSLKTIFTAQDRGLRHISTCKQNEIDQIFRRLSKLESRYSIADSWNEQHGDGFASWYRDDMALMESYTAGMWCIL